MERAEIDRELREAFATAARRPEPPLVEAGGSDQAYRTKLETLFASPGDVLDAAFLEEHVHASWSLRLPVWRWYWRQLLLTSLAAPWDDYERDFLARRPELSLIHSSAYVLRPNPCGVLRGGGASEVIATRGRLTQPERVAIARYLQYVLEYPAFTTHNLAQLASQAIRWCWNDDPGALAAAEAFRQRVRSYRRPPAEHPRDEALVVQIETAFADTPPPPTGNLMTSTWEEASEYALELADTTWQSIQPWFLSIYHAAFSFMTAPAFRYFIPAALVHQLTGRSGVDPLFHLVDCLITPSSFQERSLATARTFSRPERAAIAAYLRAYQRYASEPAAVEQALRTVWDTDSDD